MQPLTRPALLAALVVGAAAPVAHAGPTIIGVGAQVGGGVEGFTNDELAETVGTGPAWNVRILVGTRLPVTFEGAYEGSAQTVDAFGLDNGALLVGTGVDAGARLNVWNGALISPYLAVGLGWRRYDLVRYEANFSDVDESDNVLELPVGAGAVLRFAGLTLDARVQFRAASGSNLVPDDRNGDGGHLAMHRWGISGNLGYEF